MSSPIVVHALNRAHALRTLCETTPTKDVDLILVDSLIDMCNAATPECRKASSSLVMCAVELTESLLKRGVDPRLPPEVLLGLERFQSALLDIRSPVESIPVQRTKTGKLELSTSSRIAFRYKSAQFQAKLNSVHKTLMKLSAKHRSSPSRNECLLEVAAFTARAAGAIFELPVLSFMRPVPALAALICDTAKTVNSNSDAAIELANHARNVTNSVVARATDTGVADEDSLVELRVTLERIQEFLDALKYRRGGRGRVVSFMLAGKDKERFTTLHVALDRALDVFTSSQTIATVQLVRARSNEFAVVETKMYSLEHDIKQLGTATDRLTVTLDRSKAVETFFFYYFFQA
ncbi:hypothetical protein C8R46DRAFT_1198946 [Mycena filopes]|nr:hypothetical protein C8R46DRAFT_1198946 [Mycena filopes]